mgnify:CR=1 FL=1
MMVKWLKKGKEDLLLRGDFLLFIDARVFLIPKTTMTMMKLKTTKNHNFMSYRLGIIKMTLFVAQL